MKQISKKELAKTAPDPKARLFVRHWRDEAVQVLICGDSSGIVADALARIAFTLGREGERIETTVAGCDPGAVGGEFRAFVKVVVDEPADVPIVASRIVAWFSRDRFQFSSVKGEV